jgi:translocation and assembly module TamB
MRRALRWIGGMVAALILLTVAAVLGALLWLNTASGRDYVATLVGQISGGELMARGVSGHLPGAPRLRSLEVRDAGGTWLVLHDVTLDWSPLTLLHREVRISLLAAERIDVLRRPVPSATSGGKPASWYGFRVDIDALRAARIELASPVTGIPAALALSGDAHLASPTEGTLRIAATRLDAPGRYAAYATFDASRLAARVSVAEPSRGLIAAAAALPDLGPLAIDASLEGPQSAVALRLEAEAGKLRAAVKGSLDLDRGALDLDLTASAPAMAPRPDLAWQSVALEAHVDGPYATPNAHTRLRIEGLTASGGAIRLLSANVEGNAGHLDMTASAEGVRVPGPKPDLLASAPVAVTAGVRLDAPGRPLSFTLTHPLIGAEGSAETAAPLHGEMALRLPDLAPFAAAANLDLGGRAALSLTFAIAGAATKVEIAGSLGLTGGVPQAVALIGEQARIGLSGEVAGADVSLARLTLNGRAIDLSASGRLAPDAVHLRWQAALSDLSALVPTMTGKARAEGGIDGPPTSLTLVADGSGEVGAKQIAPEPVTFSVRLTGLPEAPAGQVTAAGMLDRAPLALAAGLSRAPDGTTRLAIERADWKSAHAEGALSFAPGTSLPLGRIALRVTRMADLQPFVGEPIDGSLEGSAEFGAKQAHVQAVARNAGIPGAAEIGHAVFDASVADPATRPVIDARLTVKGVRAGGMSGTATLALRGPAERLALKLSGGVEGIGGAPARIESTAELDATPKNLRLATLQATWKGQTLRLLAPARIDFGAGVAVDHLRLGIGAAVLEVDGRVQPALDLQLGIRDPRLDLVRIFDPKRRAAGGIAADAHLSGSLARPIGNVHLSAAGLRMLTGPGQVLPPASLLASVQLDGRAARIDARLTAGTATSLALGGSAALEPAGPLDLRLRGAIDLAMLNPILEAQGERVRGRLDVDAGVGGTLREPRARGAVQLAGGELQDYVHGAHLTDINANVLGDGGVLRISQLTARAGAGTITGSGSIGLLAPGIPVELRVVMNDAKPLASSLLTATLDADVSLAGRARESLRAAGRIHVRRAEINIPDRLPPSVPVLNVRIAGQPAPPPPAPAPDIALDLTLDAPRAIIVRGHGLNAELGGTLRVGGTAKNPRPSGSFKMIRGQFSLAGTTLNFTEGDITVAGAGTAGASRIDPALHFVATSSSAAITATLTVGGVASVPKITLSSVPQLPQDEILARLLFGTGVASLTPFQIAGIGSALAEISGITSGGIGDPLNRLRNTLALDRLTVGTDPVNPAVTPGTSPSTTRTVLEAGRYVAPGVFLGAKQSVAGTGQETQAMLQVDITRHLKLETGIGSGLGANNVGLTYQFQY